MGAGEKGGAGRRRVAAFGAVGVGVLVVSVGLLPPESDGAFAAYDGVMYGMRAERDGREIDGHHPLFHLLTWGVSRPLKAAGVARPGHVAARIVAGVGAAALLLLIAVAAGRERWRVGLLLALPCGVMRGFLVDAAVGESVLPGAAAGLLALALATRERPSLVRTGLALVFALLCREDNILLVPGVVIGLAMGTPAEGRWRHISVFLGITGATTLLAYAACWMGSTEAEQPFWHFLTHLAENGPWTGPKNLDLARLPVHLDALSAAVVGQTWGPHEQNLWLGPAYVGAIAIAGWMLRARGAAVSSPLAAAGITILIRTLFYTWFEADNWEWLLLGTALVAWCGARAAAGDPRFGPGARRAAWVGIVLAALTALALHAPETWRSRGTNFFDAMTAAVSHANGARVFAYGGPVGLALEMQGVSPRLLNATGDPVSDFNHVADQVWKETTPSLIIIDRWIVARTPFSMRHDLKGSIFLDTLEPNDMVEPIRWQQMVYALRVDPSRLRPTSRR